MAKSVRRCGRRRHVHELRSDNLRTWKTSWPDARACPAEAGEAPPQNMKSLRVELFILGVISLLGALGRARREIKRVLFGRVRAVVL
jgi:hypothetical protein